MRKIREILRLKHEAKLSHGKIASALGISKGVVTIHQFGSGSGSRYPHVPKEIHAFSTGRP